MADYESFERYLSEHASTPVLRAEPMAGHTTFRIGGAARYAITPQNEQAFTDIYRAARASGVATVPVGNGSNLLCGDDGFCGAVLFTTALKSLHVDGGCIEAGAGVSLSQLAKTAQAHARAGLAFAYGIPGTVGGAVLMNAGAYGGEIADVLESVRFYDAEQDTVVTLPKEACGFGYRQSVFAARAGVILSARFALYEGDADKIRQEMDQYMQQRRDKQPLEAPSAGSVFKRCAGHYTGQMIEQAGLKGRAIGGAEVSCKHAGFIINRGGATAKDVTALIALIRAELAEKYGVELECEIKRLGDGFSD